MAKIYLWILFAAVIFCLIPLSDSFGSTNYELVPVWRYGGKHGLTLLNFTVSEDKVCCVFNEESVWHSIHLLDRATGYIYHNPKLYPGGVAELFAGKQYLVCEWHNEMHP